jgi:hypothetical protein
VNVTAAADALLWHGKPQAAASREASPMLGPNPLRFAWTADDQAAFVKWRRGVFIFYAGIGVMIAVAALLLR